MLWKRTMKQKIKMEATMLRIKTLIITLMKQVRKMTQTTIIPLLLILKRPEQVKMKKIRSILLTWI